jgi:hypothetical protein
MKKPKVKDNFQSLESITFYSVLVVLSFNLAIALASL